MSDLMIYEPPKRGKFKVKLCDARPGADKEWRMVDPDGKSPNSVPFFPPLVYTYSGKEEVFMPPDMWWKKVEEEVQMGWKRGRDGKVATRLNASGAAEQIPQYAIRECWVPDPEKTKEMGPPTNSKMVGKHELIWLQKAGQIQAETPIAGGLTAYPLTAEKKNEKGQTVPMLKSIAESESQALRSKQETVRRYEQEAAALQHRADTRLQKLDEANERDYQAAVAAKKLAHEQRMALLEAEEAAREQLAAPAPRKKQQEAR